ncbi:MAG: DUF72 domain-containing protein [Actinomycetota bacterium]
MGASCYIGTSGFSYDHWSGPYYPSEIRQNERLAFYARDFTTVEINATFYRLQSAQSYKRWKGDTPLSFRFSVKGSRYITHLKRLRDTGEAVARFYALADELGEKLAVTLWQTPPDFYKDLNLLADFLTLLKAQAPSGVRHAFEFRSEDWFTGETYSLLDSHGCGLVIADSDLYPTQTDVVCGGFIYLRLHGRKANGYNYREIDLKPWADKIASWMAEDIDVYAYFNNDTKGFAIRNALSLRRMLKM